MAKLDIELYKKVFYIAFNRLLGKKPSPRFTEIVERICRNAGYPESTDFLKAFAHEWFFTTEVRGAHISRQLIDNAYAKAESRKGERTHRGRVRSFNKFCL